MLRAAIAHKQFQLGLRAFAPGAEAYLSSFLAGLPSGMTIAETPATSWRLTLVTAESLPVSAFPGVTPVSERWVWARLHQAWMGLASTWQARSLWALGAGASDQSQDFILLIQPGLRSAAVSARIEWCLLDLKRRWLAQTQGVLVHASAVVWRGQGFLFLGASDAGKTTVARLSQGLAEAILDDEIVLIRPGSAGYSLAAGTAGWADPVRRQYPGDDEVDPAVSLRIAGDRFADLDYDCDRKAPLRAIFILKQDQENYLRPLSSLVVAQALAQGFLEGTRRLSLSAQDTRRAVSELSNLARQMPGYELHFRRDPSFWKVIDERFFGQG